MIPDIQFMHTSFLRFNSEIFGGILPLPEFRLSKGRTFRGKCMYVRRGKKVYDPVIRLSVLFDLPPNVWEDVMIHEMLHLRIALMPDCKETAHGPTFMRLMHEINSKFGRCLTVSSRGTAPSSSAPVSSASEVNAPTRRYYICLAVTREGRPVVFRAAASRIFKVWDVSDRFPDFKARIWFGSLDRRLDCIPKALEPRFYHIPDMNEWRSILADAFALNRTGSIIRPGTRAALADWLKEYCPSLLPQ